MLYHQYYWWDKIFLPINDHPRMNIKTLEMLKQGKAVFFIGAGISMIPPSCLPSWWQINHIILDALESEASSLIPQETNIVKLIKKREEDGKLPPEYVAEIITNRIGDSYFEVLQGLEGESPNEAHLWLAVLAKAGLLPAIITTNFDTLVERAFDAVGVPLEVIVDPNEYLDVPKLLENHNPKTSPCLLLKLHGTATRPKTCIDTLAQRKRGLHPNINQALNCLGQSKFWIFLGYSGSDLEADPGYLGIRKRIKDSPGFAWLHLPNQEPLSVVSDLATAYGEDRGIIDVGILPQWFNTCSTLLPPRIVVPQFISYTNEEIKQIKSQKLNRVVECARSWASDRSNSTCAILLSDIGNNAGLYDISHQLIQSILSNSNIVDIDGFNSGILHSQLGEIEKFHGNYEIALENYQKAADHFKSCNHTDGYITSLGEIALIQANFGEFDKAIAVTKNNLKYNQDLSDNEGIIHAYLNLGSLYRENDNFDLAKNVYLQAIKFAGLHGLEVLRANGLLGLGQVEDILSEVDAAEEKFQEAYNIYSRLGDDAFVSESLRSLAGIYSRRGDLVRALNYLSNALQKADMTGNKSRYVRAQKDIADILLQQGKNNEALTQLKKASQTAEELNNISLLITLWQSIGNIYQNQGELDLAHEIFSKSLEKAKRFGLKVKIAGLENNLGIISEQKGNIDHALEYYCRANAAFHETHQVESRAGTLGNIGNIFLRKGDYNKASEKYRESLRIFEQLNNVDGIIRTQYNLANAKYYTGEVQASQIYFEKAIKSAEKYQQINLRDTFQMNYASVLFGLENFDDAIRMYSQVSNSFSAREDYYQAGLASYYCGLAFIKMQSRDDAIYFLELAINSWNKLDTMPEQKSEIENILLSLNST
ncbi:Photosystem I assembly protein Ycf3 [Candidatus Lokiarchaeum ossiferum]|uniref:Photosystem I assembly protein Ycf3 n=1 Tax=Candidatus Lokiarchaeum ossiferum TaxID=2951803 RepID=A0ABY6HXH0_9ARCH|nr:Photosystem I assembly protein Ycf3 [Candidatus Lokiarchaeum sp. B-35]